MGRTNAGQSQVLGVKHVLDSDRLDGEGHDYNKRQRTGEGQIDTSTSSDQKLLCPLCRRPWPTWKGLRDHFVRGPHKPRPEDYDRCGTCGDLFKTSNDWEKHTSARQCQRPEGGVKELSRFTRRQFDDIKRLKEQGKKSGQTNKQLSHAVWKIARGDDPYPAYEPARRMNLLPILRDNGFQNMASNLPYVQHLAPEDRVEAVIQIYEEVTRWIDRGASDSVCSARENVSAAEHQRPDTLQLSTSSSSEAQAPQPSATNYPYTAGINDSLEDANFASCLQSDQRGPSQADPSASNSWIDASSYSWVEDVLSVPQNEQFGPQFMQFPMVQNDGYQDTQPLGGLSMNAPQEGTSAYGASIPAHYPLPSGYQSFQSTSVDLDTGIYPFGDPTGSGDLSRNGMGPKQN